MKASPSLIGIGAGIVAAVLFASLANSSAVAFLLFFLTPLPLLLAGIGWGARAAILSLLTSIILLGLLRSPQSSLEYGVYIGLPGILISYLMGLYREAGAAPAAQTREGAAQIEWYPLGRMIAWVTIMAGVLYGMTVLFGGKEIEANRLALRALFQEFANKDPAFLQSTGLTLADLERLADLVSLYFLRFFEAMFWLLVIVGNLWLAIKSAAISSLLARPMPDFRQIIYPPFMVIGFGAAVIACFLPGALGMAATAFLGAFYSAYLILGSVVAHVLWSSSPLKPVFLALMYSGLILAHWIVGPSVVLLGLAEMFFHLRQRIWQRMTPPGNGPGPTH